MASETPMWLNPSFIEKVLRNSENDNSIQVIDISSKSATAKGDNYGSKMIRIIAECLRDRDGHKITEKISIIAKILPIYENIGQEFINQLGVFQTEIQMMSDTLNKMNKLLGPKYRLSGKVLYVQKEDPVFLLLEDLIPLGFRMADRLSGLDLDHCILALHGLARFHAASVAICEKEPNQTKMYSKGIFSVESSPEMKNFCTTSVKILANEIVNWPGMKRYSEKVDKLANKIYELGINVTKVSEDEFNVINHGDVWVNNMMFKYDDADKPVEHIFVDFQLSIYSSPAIDLLYFFNTSPSPDVIENQKDILINEYLDTLSTVMKQLDCKTQPPTINELKTALRQRASYGMITSFTVLPIVLCSKTDVKTVDEMFENGVFKNPGFKSESYKKLMMKRLPIFDEWGLLDL